MATRHGAACRTSKQIVLTPGEIGVGCWTRQAACEEADQTRQAPAPDVSARVNQEGQQPSQCGS